MSALRRRNRFVHLALLALAVAAAASAAPRGENPKEQKEEPTAPAELRPMPVDATGFQVSAPSRVAPGGQGEIGFTIQIRAGFAILSSRLQEPGFQPMKIELEAAKNLRLDEARLPRARTFKVGERRLAAYQNDLRIEIPVAASAGIQPGLRQVQGTLTYQVCSAQECFIPIQQKFTLQVDIAP